MRGSFANVIAGTLIALLNISVAISSAALIFAGADPRLLVTGIAVMLLGTFVAGLGGALFSGFPAIICSPRSAVVPIFAVMAMGIGSHFDQGYSSSLRITLIVAFMITTLVTGLFLLLLGRLKLGKLVRYIPYPVTGGFFAGIGYLFIEGGLEVAGGRDLSVSTVLDPGFLRLALPAVGLGLVLILGKRFGDNRFWVPGTLAVAITLFYGVLLFNNIGIDQAQSSGLLPQIESNGGLLPAYDPRALGEVNWLAVSDQISGIVVVALLSAMILLLDVSGIEVMSRRDLDPDHELQVMGYTNMVASVAGGVTGVHDASDTALVTRLGGDSRLVGGVYVVLVALAMLAGTEFMSRVPTFVLGGLLIYLGFEFLINWLWKARGELPVSDYAVVLLILVVIIFSDILQGVTFGLFIAIVLFVVNYSQLSVIKNEVTGSDHASNIDRDLETRELLNREGNRILILSLQGFIFFGTADKLITTIRSRVMNTAEPGIDYLVLDFHHVDQLDTSASVSFTKLAQLSDRLGFHILVSGADERTIKQLVRHGFFTFGEARWKRLYKDQLDTAVAWCETDLLASLSIHIEQRSKSLAQILEQVTGSVDDARLLAKYFVEEVQFEGAYLFREGERGESLYFVGAGTVAVVTALGSQHERVIRQYKAGALFGEMSVYTSETRSASVRIDQDAVLYRLDQQHLIELQREHPETAASFHSYIVRLLSERLRRTNRELNLYL